MRIPKKLLVVLCSVALIMSLVPMTALAATAYSSSVVSSTVPATMTTGQVVYAKIAFKNTGANTWTAARGIQLKETDTNKMLPYAYKLGASDSIKANQSKTFTVKITAPAKAGTYTLKLRLYRNSTAFGATYTKTIVVKTAVKTLASIAVTTQPTKTEYVVGEGLDITGIVVTGTYSDGSKAPLTIAQADVTGFDSSKAAVDQVLTVKKDNKTATFKVTIKDAGVSSMKSINAMQVKVVFNTPVMKTDAQDKTNYQINTINPTAAEMQSDGKTVILTMAAPLNGGALYYVKQLRYASDVSKLTKEYNSFEIVKDATPPTVDKIEMTGANEVTFYFSEPIKSISNIIFTQDGSAFAAPSTSGAIPATGALKVSYDVTNAAFDKTVSVKFIGVLDMVGNCMEPNPLDKTFTKVKTDTTAPTVASADATSLTTFSVKFSEKIGPVDPTFTYDSVAVAAASVATTDRITFTVTIAPAATEGTLHRIGVNAGYQDVAGNTQNNAFYKLATFKADVSAPKKTGSELKSYAGKQWLVVHFDEDVKVPAAATISTLYTANYIQKTVPYAAVLAKVYNKADMGDIDDPKSIIIDVSAWPSGSYVATLPAGYVEDLLAHATGAITLDSFTLSGQVDSSVPKADTYIFSADNGYYDVTFSKEMDPTTALNVANYKIGPVTFSSATFVDTYNHVRLTVVRGSCAYTGDYMITISGIKDTAGHVMTAVNEIKNIKENTKPEVTKANLSDKKVLDITFSEALKNAIVAGDVEVTVNGTADTVAGVAMNASKTIATLTLTTGITASTDKVVIKIVGAAVVDAADNPLANANTGISATIGG